MSIRARITIWYTLWLAVILLVFSGILYSIIRIRLTQELDDTIRERAQQVAQAVEVQALSNPVRLFTTHEISLPPIDIYSANVGIQIVQKDGSIAAVSSNLESGRLPNAQAGLTANLQGRPIQYVASEPGGILHIYSQPIMLGNTPIGAVQVGQSLSEVERTMRVVATGLGLGSLLALVVAAFGGMILAGRSLRPIDRITRTARNIINTQDLGERLGSDDMPQDEVGRLAGTFNEMLDRLQRLFQTQERLVADISHELRTPLTTVRGNVDLLRRGAIDDPQMREEALQAIQAETERMARLVADLTLMAQADAGMKLTTRPVEMDTLLLEVYRQARIMVPRHENGKPVIDLRLGHEDLAQVLGDADRLRQLLLNLTENAIKYTPGGGTVTLALYHEPGKVRVIVSDTGTGIAPDDLPHIFDRFYRADKARTSGGSGLGLSIAKWVTEAHGGTISVVSEPGQGSTFTVELPDYGLNLGGAAPLDEVEAEPASQLA